MIKKGSAVTAILIVAGLSGSNLFSQTKPGLDTTAFIVMGEGLAAGMANYGLSSVVQQYSFPAQVAAQMKTAFVQPLIQPPGIGDVIGYPGQEVKLQVYPQGSVREFYTVEGSKVASPPLLLMNLSVPGLTLAESLTLRPVLPVAQRNMKQTVVNLILGFPQLFVKNVPLWSQFEYAKAMFPSVALVELGYYEALDAAVNGDPNRMPDPAAFGANYNTVLAGLRSLQTQVIATTIPNPLDTAYFSTPAVAAQITATNSFVITAGFRVGEQDYLTRNALMTISNYFTNSTIGPLPAGSVLPAATAAAITNRVNALNTQIVNAAKANGAVVYDLNAFLRRIRLSGATVGNNTLTADYLGGFYSMDAVYPGPTGHSLIANDLINFINQTYSTSFPLVNVTAVAAEDQTIRTLKPRGEEYKLESLRVVAEGTTVQ